eukprot:923023_1
MTCLFVLCATFKDAMIYLSFFFNQTNRKQQRNKQRGIELHSIRHLTEAMVLALAQCYYYRLSEKLRDEYKRIVMQRLRMQDINFSSIIQEEQNYLVDRVEFPQGIAMNRAFKENLFVMLVGIATKTPTVIVGKPGSSKTLAMMTLQDNLSSAQKNDKLTELGFHDYWVIPFQCSKLTEAQAIADKWKYAEEWEQKLQTDLTTTSSSKSSVVIQNKVIFFLDEVGLAEQSPYRPLKVLHKLLEHPRISFIGLSNWKLDAAKMNRCVLHSVLPPSDHDLQETAKIIMKGGENESFTVNIQHELGACIEPIANIYQRIIDHKTDKPPLNFDFYGHRDFYSLISYLKFRLNQDRIGRFDRNVLIEAVLRNFGGLDHKQTEEFLFPKISKCILKDAELTEDEIENIWHQCSPLNLIRTNIKQTRAKRKVNTVFQLRNIMMITENPALFKILFDANILQLNETHVIFGSKFENDKDSNIYLYRTIDTVRSAMIRGDTCVLLNLDQLYDSLYDVLNQRYLNIDDQKFCRICIGGESITCRIHPSFKIIVVVPTTNAHHIGHRDHHTPTAFLNRFEKAYLDIDLLQRIGIDANKQIWDQKWEEVDKMMSDKYSDHYGTYRYKDLFPGYTRSNSVMSRITLILSCDSRGMDAFSTQCYQKLLKMTSLQYLIQDRRNLRTNDGFEGYSDLVDLLRREGVNDSHKDTSHQLLRVVTFDTYQTPSDFDGHGMKIFDSLNKNDIAINDAAVHVQFKELFSFKRERDFYEYILAFLDNNKSTVSTLIIECDPIAPTSSESMFAHYLHAQYLVEKARTHAIAPNIGSNSNDERNTAKNIVFLIYMYRSNPYPLLFSRSWKHLYCDALSVSDHTLLSEIQINDINMFNDDGKQKLLNRVYAKSGEIVKNNYMSALFQIDIPTHLHDELERFKLFLDNPGNFYQTLIERISKVLKDVDTGAEKCISNAFNKSQLDNRGSFRSQVMQMLGKKIESELVHVLAAIFSNGNSHLYKEEEAAEEKYQDPLYKNESRLWLDLLSEPEMIRFKTKSYGQQKKTPTANSIQAAFPFSANIHSYFLGFKTEILSNYNDATPIDESGEEGQSFLLKELLQRLNDANLDFPITNLPIEYVRNLLSDIVQLESTRLGIKTGTHRKQFTECVSTLIWQISMTLHEEALGIKQKQNQQKEKLDKMNIDVESSSDEEAEDYAYSDNDETQEEKGSDPHEEMNLPTDDVERREITTVQCHEIYASMWSHQRITLQFIDILSCVESSTAEIMGEWNKANIAFIDRFGQTMKKLLAEIKLTLLQALPFADLKAKADKMLSIASSFDGVFEYLGRNQFVQTRALIVDWKRIHLSLICASACKTKMNSEFIENVYQRFETFDDVNDLEWLIQTMRKKLKDSNKDEMTANGILQYLYQVFITEFSQCNNNEFIQTLLGMCLESEHDIDEDDVISLRLNPFSKLQTLSKILQLIRPDHIKEDEKEEFKEHEELANVKIRLSAVINEIAEDQSQSIADNSLVLYLLSCEEQYLYYKYKTENEGKPVAKMPQDKIKDVINRFNESFKGTKLDQLLTIAECKLMIFYFVRFISTIYRKKKVKFTAKGLEHGDRIVVKGEYMETLSQIFQIPMNCDDQHLISIKKGFQYFILSSLWHSVLGPQRAMQLANVDHFAKTLHIDVMTAMKDTPHDNPFQLLKAVDATVYDQLESALTFKNEDINWKDNPKYIVFVMGALFNHGYIKGGISDAYLTNILTSVRQIANNVSQQQIDNDDRDQRTRVYRLFNSLCCNSMYAKLKFKKTKSLEQVQLIRMMYHLIGVVLSLPKSPLSILFHDPSSTNDSYVVGMPDDPASQLFKYFKNCGAWLCPNGHMYFIEDCTWPDMALTCADCGLPTGLKQGDARSHEAAEGNKRLGTIDADGVLHVDPSDNWGVESFGAYTQFAEYKPTEKTPTGYIDCGPADALRGMNAVSLRIIRLLVDVVLFMHHCGDDQLSQLTNIACFESLQDFSYIYKKLVRQIERYVAEIGEKLGIQSNEETLYVIHSIIHHLYMKYPQWIAQDGNTSVVNITDIEQRKVFEQFLVQQCIVPTVDNAHQSIQHMRDQCSNELMRKWSARIGETIDLESDHGLQFVADFKPSLFLQFRFVTLYQFQTIMLRSVTKDEKTHLKKLYPITFGIMECIDLGIGYSVFAVQYLPFMITWMKHIKSRLNQRIDRMELIQNREQYTAQWLLEQCKKVSDPEWKQALDGFVTGWNHVASRVTVDKDIKNKRIQPSRSLSACNDADDHEEGKDDEKEAQHNEKEKEEEKDKDDDNDTNDDGVFLASKNPFRKYVVIMDACEALTIVEIKGDAKNTIEPKDVPLSFALDSNSEEFTESKMIRFLLQHLVEANNKLLRMCWQLNEDDNGEAIGLSPRLCITELSQQRCNDVINIDEEELVSLIQQCAKPRLRYGEDCKLDIDSFNLRFLETQLQQKYIVGRKFLECGRIKFEFAGEHNIPSIIQQINTKYKAKTLKTQYFNATNDAMAGLISLKLNIEQNCEYVEEQDTEEEAKSQNQEMNRQNRLKAYQCAMQAVEQTLIAILRQDNYPHPQKIELFEFMKNTLHLYSGDYMAFNGTNLKLQHIDVVWRCLEKEYTLCEDKWTETPDIMDCYLDFINDDQQTQIMQLVEKDIDQIWIFLGGLRRFMQRNCMTKLPNFQPNKEPLIKWLTDAEDIKDEIRTALPPDLMMSHIGWTYGRAAQEYKKVINNSQT